VAALCMRTQGDGEAVVGPGTTQVRVRRRRWGREQVEGAGLGHRGCCVGARPRTRAAAPASPVGGRRGGDRVVADGQVLCVSEREGKRYFWEEGAGLRIRERKRWMVEEAGFLAQPKFTKVPNIFQIDYRSLPVLVNSIHILITVKN